MVHLEIATDYEFSLPYLESLHTLGWKFMSLRRFLADRSAFNFGKIKSCFGAALVGNIQQNTTSQLRTHCFVAGWNGRGLLYSLGDTDTFRSLFFVVVVSEF